MRERVDDLLGAHSERAHLCTFHSFATDVLGQHGSHLGIRPDFQALGPGRRHNLFVVADDDQIIYQWNGASPRRFRDLRSDYDVRTLELPESYRCPPAIVALANRLVARNTRRISDRRTVAVRDHDGTYPAVVRCEVLPTPEREAEFVADDIEDRGLRPGDCVVLGRTNRLIRSAADTLSHAGYEACVPRKKSEFDSPALNVLVEALRLANSRHDRVVLRRICLAWEGLTGVAIEPQAVSAAAALVGGRLPAGVGRCYGRCRCRKQRDRAEPPPERTRGCTQVPRDGGAVSGWRMAGVERRRCRRGWR